MTKIVYDVFGIMITPNEKDYKLRRRIDTYEELRISFGITISYKDLSDLNTETSKEELRLNKTLFIIMYEEPFPDIERHLNVVLDRVKTFTGEDNRTILVSVGLERTPLPPELINRFYIVRSTEPKDDVLSKEMKFFSKIERVKSEFAIELETIRNKSKKLRDDGHITAANKALELYQRLGIHANTYFLNPEQSNYIEFKKQVKDNIKDAYDELSQHRGWKRLLGNIALAILGFGILYLAAVMINRNIFFNKTDSAEKLDELDRLVDINAFRI